MLLNDRAADGEAQSCSTLLPGIGGVDLLEAVEDRLQLVLGYAPAVVDDADGYPIQQPFERDRYLRLGGENLMALLSRLVITCCRRSGSAST